MNHFVENVLFPLISSLIVVNFIVRVVFEPSWNFAHRPSQIVTKLWTSFHVFRLPVHIIIVVITISIVDINTGVIITIVVITITVDINTGIKVKASVVGLFIGSPLRWGFRQSKPPLCPELPLTCLLP